MTTSPAALRGQQTQKPMASQGQCQSLTNLPLKAGACSGQADGTGQQGVEKKVVPL